MVLAKMSLSLLARPAIAVARPFLSWARRLRAEKHAGDGVVFSVDFLNAAFDQTLNRIESIRESDTWGQQVLQLVGAAYVRPEYLDKPTIRAWLQEPTVHGDIKALACAKFIPAASDLTSVRMRLAERYSFYTSELNQLATGPIDGIPRSRENPKIFRIYDTEVVCH